MHRMMLSMTTQSDATWVPVDTFGSRLALVRQHFGWNVKEAADNCGIPAQSWRGWERDNVLPSRYVQVCEKIAEATGADYLWLLDGRHFVPSDSLHTPEYADSNYGDSLTLRNQAMTSSFGMEIAA